MKKFLQKIAAYFGILFSIALVLQLYISHHIAGKIVSDNNPTEVRANQNANLLFLGNSRCSVHFDPRFFESHYNLKCANLGINGHPDITMAKLQLKLFLMSNPPPQYVILNFDPFTIGEDTIKKFQTVLKDEFARYAFFPDEKGAVYAHYFNFNFLEKYIPLYALFQYRQFRNCLLIKNTNDYKKYGYQKRNFPWDTLVPTPIKKLQQHYFKKEQIPSITKALGELNAMCKQHHIKLLCIQTPVHKIIYDAACYSETREICRQLAIPFIDVNTSYFTTHTKLYYNPNHLNTYGVLQMNLFLKNNPVFNSFIRQ